MAVFIHCYAHRLNLVLTQWASKLRECRIFFVHLNGLVMFLYRSPNCMQLLDIFLLLHQQGGNIALDWSAVSEKRAALKELFKHIVEHHDEYNKDSVCCADGYNAHLDDFEFCFISAFQFSCDIIWIWMCFLEYCRIKHSMYNSVCQEWTSFVTPLRGREGNLVRFMSLPCVKQVHQAHREAMCRGIFTQGTRNSTATFWTTSLPRYGTSLKTSKKSCFSLKQNRL